MKAASIPLALLMAAGLSLLGHAKPNIPQERIPPETPADVRAHIEGMYSRDPVTRAYSAVHLSRMGDRAEPAVPFLVAMLGDDVKLEWEVRDTDSPLEEAKKRMRGMYKEKETSPGTEAARALSRICTSAIEPLLAALKSSEAPVRKNAADALGGIRDAKAVAHIVPLLKDEDKEVRAQAARSLGRLRESEAAGPLIEALKDPDRNVRRESVAALGEIRDPGSLHALLGMLRDVIDVREAAEAALLETRDPRAVEPLIVSLKDRNEAVRRIAARLLGAINDRRAVRPLILALKDSSSDVRYEATVALKRMSGEDYGADPDRWQRWWELDSAARDLEEKMTGDPVHAYIAALRHPEWAARAYAAKCLGDLRDTRAVNPLKGGLWDKDPAVRVNAAAALGAIGDPRAVEALIAAVADADAEVQEAAEFSLRVITGANFVGHDTKRWQEWWEENKDVVFEQYRQRTHEKVVADAARRPEELPLPKPRNPVNAAIVLIILGLVVVGPVAALFLIRMFRTR